MIVYGTDQIAGAVRDALERGYTEAEIIAALAGLAAFVERCDEPRCGWCGCDADACHCYTEER